MLWNIPAHKNCQNCGECCGVVPVTFDELQRICDYIKDRPDVRNKAREQAHRMDMCPFRDNTEKRCMIYPARPLLCRLFGVTAKMQCAHGNSAEIDGSKFMTDYKLSDVMLLNELDW